MKKKAVSEFQLRLDRQHTWPSLYMFKFIVPKGKEQEIRSLFPKNDIFEKASNNGNYYSLTIKVMMNSSAEVIRIYNEANKVKGIIAL